MELFVQTLIVISAIDLLLNFFFHLIQLKRYCSDEVFNGINNLINRVDGLKRTIKENEESERFNLIQLHETIKHIYQQQRQEQHKNDKRKRDEKIEGGELDSCVENTEFKEHSD